VNTLELKVPPVMLVLIIAVFMWLVSAYVPSLAFDLPWRIVVAIAFAGAGIIMIGAGVAEFRKTKTTVNPTKLGTTSAMVTSGFYRLSRNPMYVGLLLALAGWAAFLSHALAFAFLPAFVGYMNRFQIAPEERSLSAKFGPAFSVYRQSVRRWL